jgi:hypothetical protein
MAIPTAIAAALAIWNFFITPRENLVATVKWFPCYLHPAIQDAISPNAPTQAVGAALYNREHLFVWVANVRNDGDKKCTGVKLYLPGVEPPRRCVKVAHQERLQSKEPSTFRIRLTDHVGGDRFRSRRVRACNALFFLSVGRSCAVIRIGEAKRSVLHSHCLLGFPHNRRGSLTGNASCGSYRKAVQKHASLRLRPFIKRKRKP